MILKIWNEREKVETVAPKLPAGLSAQMVVAFAERGPCLGGRLRFAWIYCISVTCEISKLRYQIVTWI